MRNDTTTTFLNFVLAALVILGVTFALMSIWNTRELRQKQFQIQQYQLVSVRAQALLNDSVAYNATAKNPEMNQILQSVQTAAPAAK